MPTTMRAWPLTMRSSARLRSAVESWPVSRVGISSAARSGPSDAVSERRCWLASTSVGASSADWPPVSATASIARSATSVLPEPTSPCTSRFIGQVRAMSVAISSPTSRWSPVSSKGSWASSRSRWPPAVGIRGVAGRARAACRRCRSAVWRTNASWKRRASRPRFQSTSFSGRWTPSSASRYGSRPRSARTSAGTGSSRSSTASSASSTDFATCQLAMEAVAG